MTKDTVDVLHVIRSFEIGGAEKLVLKLASAQAASGGVVPQIASLMGIGPLREEASARGLITHVVGVGGVKYVSGMCRILRLLKRLKPDIVHTHNFLSHVHAAPVARVLRIPVVHTKHGRAVTSIGWAPWLRRAIYNLADRIVVVSGETGTAFREKTGVDESKIRVVYNGIDTGGLSGPGRDDARGRLGIPSGVKVLGTVSRLDRVKDHDTLLEAFARVVSRRKDCLLIIIGDGPERGNIERKVEALGLDESVRLIGFTDQVPLYLAAMDLFLQPSKEEGLSMTILEAMAAGLPVIATPVGGTPEVIDDGETGRLVDVGNAEKLASCIVEFLEKPDEYAVMAKNARLRVEREFTLERMAEGYEKVYREVLGGAGRRGQLGPQA